jgi:hypothetical protein
MTSSVPLHAIDRRAKFAALHGVPLEAVSSGPRQLSYDVTQGSAEVDALIKDIRGSAEAFIVLSGGASKMTETAKAQLIGLFDAFAVLGRGGTKFAVGDGGTKAGIMEAAGNARAASAGAFRLVGVSPAPEIEPGKTAMDPNHSEVIGVSNAPWLVTQKANGWQPDWGFWGSETASMYDIFGKIAAGKPSICIVANGGGITLDEVKANVAQGRKMLVIHGSGRMADAICETVLGLPHTANPDAKVEEEFAKLSGKVQKANLPRGLFIPFEVSAGPGVFAQTIVKELKSH